jgi:hypothetical protein
MRKLFLCYHIYQCFRLYLTGLWGGYTESDILTEITKNVTNERGWLSTIPL